MISEVEKGKGEGWLWEGKREEEVKKRKGMEKGRKKRWSVVLYRR